MTYFTQSISPPPPHPPFNAALLAALCSKYSATTLDEEARGGGGGWGLAGADVCIVGFDSIANLEVDFHLKCRLNSFTAIVVEKEKNSIFLPNRYKSCCKRVFFSFD